MRKITTGLGLLLVLGWAASAHAGDVAVTFDLSQSTGAVHTEGFAIPSDSVMGSITLTFTDPSSSPASTITAPIPHGDVHLDAFTVTATGSLHFLSFWDITGTVKASLVSGSQTSTFSHGTDSQSRVLGSQSGQFHVYSKGHCSGNCGNGLFSAPGTWPNGASSTQTQTFTVSAHIPTQVYRHATNSDKYLESGTATIVPPGNHLAASNTGYQTFHVVGKEVSRTHP